MQRVGLSLLLVLLDAAEGHQSRIAKSARISRASLLSNERAANTNLGERHESELLHPTTPNVGIHLFAAFALSNASENTIPKPATDSLAISSPTLEVWGSKLLQGNATWPLLPNTPETPAPQPWHAITSRVHSNPTDWTMMPQTWVLLIVPMLAYLLSCTIHRPQAMHRRTDDFFEGFADRSFTSVPILALTAGLASWFGAVGSAASTPMLFAIAGYAVARLPRPIALLAPALVSYVSVLGVFAASQGLGLLEVSRFVAERLVPLEALSSQRLSEADGPAFIVANFGGAIACIALTPALKTTCRGGGWMSLTVVWFMSLMGSAADFDLRFVNTFGGGLLVSIPPRLQIPAFVSGLIVSSWRQATRREQIAGIVVVLPLIVLSSRLALLDYPERVLHMIQRGGLVPLQAAVVWALAGTFSPRLPQKFASAGWHRQVLPISFGMLFVSPALFGGITPDLHRALLFLFLSGICHAGEWAAWCALGVLSNRDCVMDQLREEPENGHASFLGKFRGTRREALVEARMDMVRTGLLYMMYATFLASKMSSHFDDREYTGSFCVSTESMFSNVLIMAMAWAILLLAAVPSLINITGGLVFPPVLRTPVPRAHEQAAPSSSDDIVMIFRYCTRGFNPALIKCNVEMAHRALVASGFTESVWRLEVVTDRPLSLAERCPGVPVQETVVPSTYKCPNGGKFKARAMHFAALNSKLCPREKDWIVHLDEETRFEPHTVCAVYQHCLAQHRLVASGQKSVPDMGQGAILYNTNGFEIENMFIALIDTCRVGDDFGKFRVQSMVLKRAAAGMHGSFAVINQGVETDIGFDLGESGSITEDSYFALMAYADKGVGMRWIDAFMFEQSPFTVHDLVRQRARWFQGLFHCTLFGRNDFGWETSLYMTCVFWGWALSWFAFLLRILDVVSCERPGVYFNFAVMTLTNISVMFQYFNGVIVNFSPFYEGMAPWLIMFVLTMQGALVFGVVESLGVIYGMYLVVSNKSEFYIVQKERTHQQHEQGHGKTACAKFLSHTVESV